MSARDELYEIISQSFYAEFQDPSMHAADAILAAGYRKAEPVWEPSLLNDGIYEYTQASTCDGSTIYNYRRPPRLQYEGEHHSWESYEPEAAE